jgi:hypothetical protein
MRLSMSFNLSLKAAKIIYVLALLLWSGAVFSIEANHRMMQGASTEFSSPQFLPTKYFSFTREMSRLNADTVVLKESWDIEIPQNPDGNNLLFLPPVYEGKYEYTEISGTISTGNEAWEKVTVGFKRFEIEDENQIRIRVKVAYLKIPKTQSTSRLRVNFSIKGTIVDGLEQSGLTIALPPETPVKEAKLILKWAPKELKNLAAELNGFTERQNASKSGSSKEYALSKEWLGSTPSGGESVPKVAVSNNQWSTIAAKHARFYKSELARDDVIDLFKVDPAIQDIVKNANLSKVEKAYQLFKWIGQYLSYIPGGETFKVEEKYTPNAINDTLTKRTGNCLDYTLLYLKLLSLAEIYAEPVEVNVGNNGAAQLDTTVPREGGFNHVIVYIPAINMYVDPTDSAHKHTAFTLFGIASATFSNVYGLNLFTGKLVQINAGQVQNKISIATTYSRVDGQWIGKTTWHGSGEAYRTMSMMEHQRDQRKARGEKLDRVFTNSKTRLLADTWKSERDDILSRATLSFSFVMGAELLDSNGRPRYLPVNVMTAAILKYEFLNLLKNPDICFGSESSEEIIELNGQAGFSIPPDLQDVKLSGVNSNFSQKISIHADGLKLHRRYFLNEKRATCSAADLQSQKKFHVKILELKARTHAVTSSSNAK